MRSIQRVYSFEHAKGQSKRFGGGPARTFVYTYNLADALLQTTYPSGRKVTNSYDVANRVIGVTGALGTTSTAYVGGTGCTGTSTGICYAASGAPASFTYNNGVARAFSYNSLLQPTSITDALSGTTLFSLGHTFGATGANNGNPTQVAIAGLGSGAGFTQNYGYDKLNRLCAAAEATAAVSVSNCVAPTTGVNWAQNLSYDRYGNMWAPTASQAGVSGITALAWMPTAQSQINAASNQLTVSGLGYDSGGGNQNAFLGASFTYDAENRQVQSVTSSSTIYAYAYDGLGQRVSRTVGGVTTNYVHDVFGNLAAEYNPPSAAACTTCYLSWDHLGSTRMVTDGSTTDGTTGQIVARHDFLPFGAEIPNGVAGRSGTWCVLDGLSPKFTGQDHDTETFLEFYQARYMASGLGRFMGVDPGNAGADATDPQSWNMYSYVRNNPLVLIDPSGLDDCDPSDASCGGPGDSGISWPVWGSGGWNGGSGGTQGGVMPIAGPQQGPGGANGLTGGTFPGIVPPQYSVAYGVIQDLAVTLWGFGADAWWTTVHLPGRGPAPKNPTPRRLFGTYYCGPGGAGPKGGVVNGACAAHDACYADAGIDAAGNTNPGISWTPAQVKAARSCNQGLYNAVKGSTEPGATLIHLWLLYGDGLILRPGTAAHQ